MAEGLHERRYVKKKGWKYEERYDIGEEDEESRGLMMEEDLVEDT